MEQLLEFITSDNVIFGLKSVEKNEIIKELLQKAIDINLVNQSDFDAVYDALLKREKSMSTGIGSGVAIPHCSIDVVDDIRCVVGLSDEPKEFDAIDKLPVQIFIVLIVPRSMFQEHIKTLAVIAKTLGVKEERDKLLACHSYGEIRSAFKRVTH